jgi:hypothetical protein
MSTGNVCSTCGGSGQACCGTGNAGTCSAGFACSGRNAAQGTAGTCGACGGTGQTCCGGATPCTAGACMLGASDNVCSTCGGSAQSCCGTGNAGTCSAGFVCSGRGHPGTWHLRRLWWGKSALLSDHGRPSRRWRRQRLRGAPGLRARCHRQPVRKLRDRRAVLLWHRWQRHLLDRAGLHRPQPE